jgi:hypothetical protein
VGVDEWLLALHLLSAFALVGSLTAYSIAVVLLQRGATPVQLAALTPVLRVGGPAIGIGILGTLVFGLWLAISLDAYSVFDGWVLLALVLWVAATGLGQRGGSLLGRLYDQAGELAARGETGPSAELAAEVRASRGPLLHWLASALTVLVLVDMVWKPGA